MSHHFFYKKISGKNEVSWGRAMKARERAKMEKEKEK